MAHTITLGTVSNNVQVPLAMKAPPFDPLRDVTPLAQVASVPLVMTVPASSPAKDVQGFVALAKANPGGLNFASNGVGTSQHMAAELFMLATGTRMVHVPYRGSGPASIDLAANVVQVNFDTLSTVLPHIRGERLRGLAVTTRARSDQLPGVPTMIESGIADYDIDLWYMLFGPAGLPDARGAALVRGAGPRAAGTRPGTRLREVRLRAEGRHAGRGRGAGPRRYRPLWRGGARRRRDQPGLGGLQRARRRRARPGAVADVSGYRRNQHRRHPRPRQDDLASLRRHRRPRQSRYRQGRSIGDTPGARHRGAAAAACSHRRHDAGRLRKVTIGGA